MTSGERLAAKFEGLYLKPYLCPAGVATIGYGATRGFDGKRITLAHPPITRKQAEALLARDFSQARTEARRLAGKPLKPHELEALADFVFNLGATALAGSTLLRKLKRGEPFGEQWGRWNKAAGKPLRGLTLRREAERKLYEFGELTS